MTHEPLAGEASLFHEQERQNAVALIELALKEDLGDAGDITANATIPPQARGAARFVARSEGVLAGLPVIALLASHFEIAWGWQPCLSDGDRLGPGSDIARIEGPMRALLAMERTALNFLQRLSGIATLTARFVAAVTGTKAVILDTRKTTPGWRALEKYAVRCGGGSNHRAGLYDGVLIKDNHLAWLAANQEAPGDAEFRASFGQGAHNPLRGSDAISQALLSARFRTPKGTAIELEVDTLMQFDRAIECGPDIILLDNFSPELLAEAVRRRDARAPHILLEASGGVTLATARALAQTGVDRISVGALTHSAPALDIGLDFDKVLPA
ncbi:MAG: nicotinate-nucleotide diphosphorylase [Isosphaeraceae bacterium]|nr:nicotinate-nucleotide diphosphorylase [Isosphaeraceae bacterium]